MVELSQEQKAACNYAYRHTDGRITAVEAVSGSGKSFMLKTLDSVLTGRRLYTSFAKSLVEETKSLYPPEVEVTTFHSYCYDVVIRQGLGGGKEVLSGPRTITTHFTYRDVTSRLEDTERELVVKTMEQFFGSQYVSILEFIKHKEVPEEIANLVIYYIKEMVNKKRPVTFDFIIKWFHILLHRKMFHVEPYEAIYLDESQDFSATGLEIFKLLPAKRKLLVGDGKQALYSSFTESINGFIHLKDDISKSFPLTRSFRVNIADAKTVQGFMREHVDDKFQFSGHDHHDTTIRTTGYITRTNASLIAKMLELTDDGIEYGLVRKVGNLFSTVITIMSLKVGKYVEGELGYLNEDITNYTKDKTINKKTTTLLKYIIKTHRTNPKLRNTFTLLMTNKFDKIWDLYYSAKKMEKSKKKCDLLLGTVFGFKGFTVDRAILSNDLNLDYIKDDKLSAEDRLTEHYIRYVSVTRHRIQLDGAEWLNKYKEIK